MHLVHGFSRARALALFALLSSIGCGDSTSDPDAGVLGEAGLADGGSDGEVGSTSVCERQGLSPRTFVADGEGVMFGDRAGEFSVNLVGGETWTFSEEFSGCESYVFFTYFPPASVGIDDGDTIFASYPDDLFERGPENVHYFFMSWEEGASARENRMSALRDSALEGIDTLLSDEASRQHWRSHFHFVTDRVTEISGSLGEFYRDYITYLTSDEAITDLGDRGRTSAPLPFVLGIDRDQRWDAGGSLDPFVGGNPEFGMAAFLPDFYNFRHDLDQRLASETADEVVLLDEQVTERVFVRAATLPDLADARSFSVDVQVNCPDRSPFECSEWDRNARVSLCVDGEECMDRRELVRWITPYWRRGRRRWEIDASPLLGLLREGGERHFHIEMGPSWERATPRDARIALRFRSEGEARATGAVRAFTGGGFDEEYNTREPFVFTPPVGVSRVELVTLVSGHGQEAANGCAEWCDHRHQFTVNDTALDLVRYRGAISSRTGCAFAAERGVPPGQWGNWAPERAYWCPGLPVEMIRHDMTAAVTLGEENTLTYEGFFQSGDPAGGDIDLSTYVVWYE